MTLRYMAIGDDDEPQEIPFVPCLACTDPDNLPKGPAQSGACVACGAMHVLLIPKTKGDDASDLWPAIASWKIT